MQIATTEPNIDQTLSDAAQGDAQAWRVLVERYTPRVLGLLIKQCHDRDLAEEITQATFVKVVSKLGQYDERGRFESWLFRIAMNRLRDEMRRRKRQAVAMDMTPGSARADQDAGGLAGGTFGGTFGGTSGGGGLEQLTHQEQLEQVRCAVETLSESDREIIYLRHTAGLTFAQIADTLEQPLGTVLARGHRALGKLKTLLSSADD